MNDSTVTDFQTKQCHTLDVIKMSQFIATKSASQNSYSNLCLDDLVVSVLQTTPRWFLQWASSGTDYGPIVHVEKFALNHYLPHKLSHSLPHSLAHFSNLYA